MGYVYLLVHSDGQRFKIGKTKNLWDRTKMVGGPETFDYSQSLAAEVDNHHALEREMHARFAAMRLPQIKGLDGGTEYFSISVLPEAAAIVAAYPCAKIHQPLSELFAEKTKYSLLRIPSPEVYERARHEDAAGLSEQFKWFSGVLGSYLVDGTIVGCIRDGKRSRAQEGDNEHYSLMIDNASKRSSELFNLNFPGFYTSYGGKAHAHFWLVTGGTRSSLDPLCFLSINFPYSTADTAAEHNPLSVESFARLYEFYATIPGFLDGKLPASAERLLRQHIRLNRQSSYDVRRGNLSDWYHNRIKPRTKTHRPMPL